MDGNKVQGNEEGEVTSPPPGGKPKGQLMHQLVEHVVKRQADLGVDIVTDGEVAFLEGLQWNCQVELLLGWQRGILHALSEARRAGD